MKLVGAGSNVMGGVYVNPYDGLVDGLSVKLICDSFSLGTYLGETWTADVSDFSDLSNTYQSRNLGLTVAQQTLYYSQAAWLAIQLLNTTNKTIAGQISYALWSVFDPDAMSYLSTRSPSNVSGAQAWLDSARAQSFTPGQFSNVSVYSPNLSYPVKCGSGDCPSSPPQEFIVVRVPEASALAGLLADLAGVGILFAFMRCRTRQRTRA